MAAKLTPICRLVAATALVLLVPPSLAGACSNEMSPGFRAYLPDCRAYELVSPAYKEGFPVFAEAISKDGSQLRIESLGSFSSPENTSLSGQSYLVGRTESEWESSPLDVPFSTFPVYHVQGMSADFESSLWFASVPGQSSRDIYLDQLDALARMGPGAPPGVREGELIFVGASDDLSHVLLLDHSPNGSEEDRLWPGDTTIGGRRPSLYEYAGTGNSEPRLVGVTNEGVPVSIAASKLVSNCGISLGSASEEDAYNAVSANGAVVFVTAEACGGSPAVNEVYARIDGKETVAISEPSKADCVKCETFEMEPGKRSPAFFQGASRNGSKVFFLSEQKLLPGAEGDNLYEYNFNAGKEGRRTDERVSLVASEMASSGEELGGVARVSEDGSHVYFVAEGALTGANREGKSPVVGEPNLYVFASECPGVEGACANPVERRSFVATLSREDKRDWRRDDVRPVQATPDGRSLVFESVASDLTSDEEGLAEAGQLFEYDAEAETLVRISHGENGYNEDGNTDIFPAVIPEQNREYSAPEERFKNLAISEDGSRIFFSSADALTPQALNSVCAYVHEGVCSLYANNIYEYHDGQIALISDGHDVVGVERSSATELIETDESGRDVFFTTADPLVPQDSDTQIDIYDARENGGLSTVEETVPCSGDSCQGAAGVPPSLLTSPTTGIAGATGSTLGATPLKPKAKIKVKPKLKKSRSKKSKGKKRTNKRERTNKRAVRRKSR